MLHIFLHPKRHSYYHRSIIPRRLCPYFKGRVQVWRSLKTDDSDEAKARSSQWNARVQRVFVTLKKHGARMTPVEIEALIARWIETELEESEDYRAMRPVTDDYLEGVQQVLSRSSRKPKRPCPIAPTIS